MVKAAFVGFGEVNTPYDIIVKKCADAEAALTAAICRPKRRKRQGTTVRIFPAVR